MDKTPVEILWSFTDSAHGEDFFQGPDEVNTEGYNEGTSHQVSVNVYERNPNARRACIDHYGAACVICGFSFEQAYGSIGREYIHVHHLVPLSAVGEEYQVDPISDLRPICPNCHAMVHRKQPPYSVEEVRQMLETQAALNP